MIINKHVLPIFLIVMLTACGGKEGTDNAQLETHISPVIPKVNGTVKRILAEDNQLVNAGDTLLVLDDEVYRIAVDRAEVALAQARQQVALAKNSQASVYTTVSTVSANANAVEAGVTSARAAVQAARVKFEVADKNFSRIRNLYDLKSATLQQFDLAKAERDGAEQGLLIAQGQLESTLRQTEASRSQIATTKSSLVTSGDNIALAELAVQQAEHELEMARLQLDYCVIRAAVNGVVSKKNVEIGQVVSVGQPLMALTDNRSIWVVANFKETQVGKMQVGQSAEIRIDAYGGKTFKGKIASLSQATGAKFSLLPPDNATGNFVKVTQRIPVKIVFDDQQTKEFPLRAGMSVSVKVNTLN